MAEPSAPCVLVVADRERVGELVAALSELPGTEVLVSSGGDDTIDLFEARRPAAVVLTASLQVGDPRSLIVALREMVPRGEVAIVMIGDDAGPIRTALDALELAPDRFVTRPLSPKALRFAVTGGVDTVRIVRGTPVSLRPLAIGARPGRAGAEPAATMRLVPPVPALRATTRTVPVAKPDGAEPARPAAPAMSPASPPAIPALARATPAAGPASSPGEAAPLPVAPPAVPTRAALRARWEALADSINEDSADDDALSDLERPPGLLDEAEPLPPPIVIKPRRQRTDSTHDELAPPAAWKPGTTDELAPAREPTLIIPDARDVRDVREVREPEPAPAPAVSRTQTGDGEVVVAARTSSEELWSDPMSMPVFADREPRAEPDEPTSPRHDGADRHDELGLPLDDADALVTDRDRSGPRPAVVDAAEDAVLADIEDTADDRPSGQITTIPMPVLADVAAPAPRDFARELRAKMSMMAQRLFQGSDAPAPGAADHAPRHDHHTEIDLASLGDDQPLGGGAEHEARAERRHELRESMTSPGSWDSQVRERGLPDTGTIMRGVSDAAMLLAKMFAQGATGRIAFRRDEVETIVYLDHGRPVFASSNEPRDRMGELLLREGKITASQYERCQTVVAESGRRMGEILVDLGYLKRRELLPAVRRHVEDIVYSLFGWERGTYAITPDPQPSAERIRLSRHPAALILEGIRRKLDRTSLERLLGAPSTVVEVRDRERLGGIVSQGDLAAEERAALAAFDGQADLAQVARTAGVDVADVLPLAWGLCALGLATARRADAEASDESTALVGETDLAIDRERVRARWQLVTDADYFALLGVRRDATGFEIRRAYQSARRDFAADCFPSELRRELARELDDIAHVLDEAFRVLRDDRLRQTYLTNLIDR